MKRLRAWSALALALAAGCSDDPTGPKLAASLEILTETTPLDERTIAVGQTVQLSASPRDPSGRELEGRSIRWTSTAPAIATVDHAGLVRGVSLGTALVIATADGAADTARINVAAPVTGALGCAAGQSPIALSVGQIYTTTAWEQPTLCIEGGAAGAEFVLIPFHGSRAAGGQVLALELAGSGVVPVAETSVAPAPADAEPGSAPALQRDEAFHLELRERALPGLTRRMGELRAGGELGPSRSLAAAVPNPGDRLRFNIQTRGSDGCADPVYRNGRVVAVTERAVVVADSVNPVGGFTDDEYRAIGTAFDQIVYPLGVEHFGAPSDIDENARTVIFFTSAVNELTTAGSGFYVGGFFYDRDLFPRTGQGSCGGSNAAEMLYMMVPDPSRQVREPAFGKESVRSLTLGVVAHEFQHLVNASRRLHVNKAPMWESLWLNEGLSHIAEELMYFRASGQAPLGNEDGSRLSQETVRRAMSEYQLSNVDRYIQFLRNPHSATPMGEDVLPTRGAVWNFLRYAADRRGGPQQAFWQKLVNSRTAGYANLSEALGSDAVPWLHDWFLSVYLDDSGLQTASRFDQPSWNFRRLIPRLGTYFPRYGFTRYPLRMLGLQPDNPLSLSLPSASGAYVRFAVTAQQRAAVRITSGGLPAPQKLHVTVLRVR